MKILNALFFLLLFSPFRLKAQQDTLTVGLFEVIDLAHSDAPNVQIAKTFFNNNYWRFQLVMADYRPQINLSATTPDLLRSIDVITLPDGKDAFINRSQMRNTIGLSLEQSIPFTGGTVSAFTGLQRLDIFATNGNDAFQSYLSTPISISFNQPLFRFNAMKWDRRLAPIRYEEAKKVYSEDMEQVAYQAAEFFFDVLIAQLNLQAAQRDKKDTDTLFAISKGRFEVGRIAETELLQIELNVMNANADLARSSLALQTSTEQLRNFLGITKAIQFKLLPPLDIPTFTVAVDKALQLAQLNRSENVSFQRRIIEAQQEVARAKGSTGLNMDLSMSFGLSQSADNLSDAYNDLLDNESLRLRISVPIADWGKAKSSLEIARSNEALTQLQVKQDRVNFEREVIIKVQQFDLVREQVSLALRAYEVAQKRLDITRKRYRIGKILITDLNLAIGEEANARRSYFTALRSFWLAYFDLRRLTLYDFERNIPLVREGR